MSKIRLNSTTIKAFCEKHNNENLILTKLEYPDIYIPNRGLAISLSFRDENDDMIQKIKRDVEEYNAYIDSILCIDGFWNKFKANGYFVSKEECESLFGKENATLIFSLKKYQFQPNLCKNGKWLFLRDAIWKYYVEVEGCKIEFELTETDSGYPRELKIGKRKNDIFWNWYEDERDFCFYLWEKAYFKGYIKQSEDDEEPEKSYSNYEFYSQGRNSLDGPDPNLMKIFKLLQDMGYLSVYYIEPDKENPIWQLRAAPDGKIGMMILDDEFYNNSLLMEKIKLLLNCPEEDVDDFTLTNEEGHQYLSKTKGLYGGHNKLKIYGKLDCPSANRYVQAGQYLRHRVFFADEKTAIKAGYRPCAKCMPEAYKAWKESK